MSLLTYPAGPSELPGKMARLSASYTVKGVLAIAAIILFFVLYVALVLSLCYLFYLALIFDIGAVGFYPILIKLGAVAGAGMLLAFTLKFLFKLKNVIPPNRIQITPEKHPQVWAFVEQICRETGAPRPKAIYVDPDVNAYVRYTNLWLSLFFPVRKELTIGLGLVSTLNLSQFKAVIAHEFGHFSQRSMRIGSYIASANTIIHSMIFQKDSWDEALQKWKSADFRLSAAAWIITPIIGLIRQILRLFYSLLNVIYSSLSREMEFNADKVAVSVAGSEAIVSALWNLDSRLGLWNGTLNHAYVAAQKGLHAGNLYQQLSFAQMRAEPEYRTTLDGLPSDERGGRKYFSSSALSKVSMYASHPPNDQREANAKTPFVPCPLDERSPWILFSDPEELQQEMTRLIYTTYLEKHPDNVVEAEEFRQFVEAELRGAELADDYENTFQDRFIYLPNPEEIAESHVNTMEIVEGLQFLKDEIHRLMKPLAELKELMKRAQEIARGTSKEKSIIFNNVTYTKKQLDTAWKAMNKRREQLFADHFIEWDTAFFALHLNLAEKLGRREELEKIYAQYYGFTKVYRMVMNAANYLMSEVGKLQQVEQVTQTDLTHFERQAHDVVWQLNAAMEELAAIPFIRLPNIDTRQELQEAIIEGGIFKLENGPIFEGERFGRFMQSLERTAFHCQRLDRKSIAHILEVHSELQKEYRTE